MEDFDIEFVKLRNGIHSMKFEIDKLFFDFFQNKDIQGASITIGATINKSDSMMVVDLNGKGTLNLSCDRCLSQYAFPVNPDFKIIYHLNAPEYRKDDNVDLKLDVFYLNAASFKVNIAESIYESFLPVIPMVKKCEDVPGNKCDSSVLNWLETDNFKEENKNEIDPRWDALKDLLKNKEK